MLAGGVPAGEQGQARSKGRKLLSTLSSMVDNCKWRYKKQGGREKRRLLSTCGAIIILLGNLKIQSSMKYGHFTEGKLT